MGTMNKILILPGITTGTKTRHINYDFEENPRQFYAVEIGGDE